MRQGARGEWLFHIPYTTEEHPGTIIYIFYLLLGKVAGLSGLSLEWTYHVARVGCGFLLLIVVYRFLARLTPHLAVRRIAFLLVVFSGGMGWLLILLGQPEWLGSLPIDLILPEGYVFLTLYSPPHLALATACLLLGTLRLQEGCSRRRMRAVLAGTALMLVVALIGAFYLLVPYGVLGASWLLTAVRRRQPDWRALGLLALSGVLPGAVVVYDYAYFAFDPVYRAWAAQNLVRSPHVAQYVAGYLIVGALALLGGGWLFRKRRLQPELPLVWVGLVPLFVYLPFNMQRRLIVGAQVPLCLLAAVGLVHAVILPFGRSPLVRWLSQYPRYSRNKMRRFLVTVVILSTLPTHALLVLRNCAEVGQRRPPIFHSGTELDAMDWLGAHSKPEDAVLCAFETGNYIPARAGNRVLLGLGPETIHADRKRVEVRRFFDAEETDLWRQELLSRYGIAYVLVGPHERALGAFDADEAVYLSKVYANEDYAVYRVGELP
jgi:hypothetical protein